MTITITLDDAKDNSVITLIGNQDATVDDKTKAQAYLAAVGKNLLTQYIDGIDALVKDSERVKITL